MESARRKGFHQLRQSTRKLVRLFEIQRRQVWKTLSANDKKNFRKLREFLFRTEIHRLSLYLVTRSGIRERGG